MERGVANANVREAETVFNVASQFAPEERPAYLDRACAGQPQVRAKVEALLRAREKLGQFLPDRPASQLADLSEGQFIGRYQLQEKIGEGGCGVVYLAGQQEPVRRHVALKVIKLGMDTKAVIARFEAERQALAMMDHPNIARVLDGGATDTGRLYLVMELVRGIPVTQYCGDHHLSAPERIKLFILVCQAIQHAHQKGIIHRDIKPSNILITLHDGLPVPKVIDFGIAKATEGRLTESTLPTRQLQLLGTPAYMSPEQAELRPDKTGDIDTRSDIYSLGVVLYELLTGRTPFDSRELIASGIDEMRRIIRDQEPTRPSRLPAPNPLGTGTRSKLSTRHSSLSTDLDWVVMKCLEKERSRRYESASGLAADLKRYLADEPVLARPPSAAYRFHKLVRRNKTAFAAATAVALTLIAGLSFSTWSFLRERKAHAAEAEQRGKADAEKIAAERHLYVAGMNLAQQVWEQNNVGRLRQLLQETQTSPNRGFEWYYWQRQTHLASRTIRGHSGDVTSVAFSPDGQRIVTGSWDQTARVWEVASGREMLRLTGHSAPIWCVAFSPDGQRIVTGSWDQTARLWDAASGTNLVALKGHGAPIRSVAFSPDGQRIVTGSWDQTARVWEAAHGRPLLTFVGTEGNVGSVAFSPDGLQIATGLADGTAKLWEAASGREVLTLKGHEHQVRSVAFSPNGRWIVTGSDDQTARVWDAASGANLVTLKGQNAEVYCVAFSPDGQRIITGGADNTARVWDAANGGELLALKGHSAAVWSVTFSPDGQRVLTGSWDQTAKVWELMIGEGLRPLLGLTNRIRSMAFSPDGGRIVTGSDDQTARVWDASTGLPVLTLQGHHAGISSAAFSADGRWIVTGSDDQTAEVWDAASGQALRALKGHMDRISCVAFSPDGRRIVTGSLDQTARIWETASGRAMLTLNNREGGISSVAFSPDGEQIVTILGDQAKVWESDSGREVLSLNGHLDRIGCVAFSPDGQRIITGSWDRTARVWETSSGRILLTLNGHNGGISSVAYSPDGQRILTGSDDNTAKIWDAISGRELLPLTGHNGGIWSVAFSPDGQRIMTGSRDQMAKVWEAASVAQVAAWQKEENSAAAARPGVLKRDGGGSAERERLHRAPDTGRIGQVTFIKWGTSLPSHPPSQAGISLAGIVGGDLGQGRLAGEILSDRLLVTQFWLGHARYEFYGEKHSFIADIHVTENNTTEPGTAVITGIVTQGWRKGAQVTGAYTTRTNCPVATPGNAFGTTCYECALQIDGGSED